MRRAGVTASLVCSSEPDGRRGELAGMTRCHLACSTLRAHRHRGGTAITPGKNSAAGTCALWRCASARRRARREGPLLLRHLPMAARVTARRLAALWLAASYTVSSKSARRYGVSRVTSAGLAYLCGGRTGAPRRLSPRLPLLPLAPALLTRLRAHGSAREIV